MVEELPKPIDPHLQCKDEDSVEESQAVEEESECKGCIDKEEEKDKLIHLTDGKSVESIQAKKKSKKRTNHDEEEAIQLRRERDRLRQRLARQNENDEKRKIRLEKDRLRKRNSRQNEDEFERLKRRDKDRERRARKREMERQKREDEKKKSENVDNTEDENTGDKIIKLAKEIPNNKEKQDGLTDKNTKQTVHNNHSNDSNEKNTSSEEEKTEIDTL